MSNIPKDKILYNKIKANIYKKYQNILLIEVD